MQGLLWGIDVKWIVMLIVGGLVTWNDYINDEAGMMYNDAYGTHFPQS